MQSIIITRAALFLKKAFAEIYFTTCVDVHRRVPGIQTEIRLSRAYHLKSRESTVLLTFSVVHTIALSQIVVATSSRVLISYIFQ